MVDDRIAIKDIIGNVDVCSTNMSDLNIEEYDLLKYENNMLYFYGINFDNIFKILFLKDKITFRCLKEVANIPAMLSNHTKNIITKYNSIPIQNIKGIVFNDCSLNKVFFDENSNIEYISFNQCDINSEIELRNFKNINLNIHKTILHKSVLFQNNKYNSLNIEFSTFKELVSFEDSIFGDVLFKDVVFLNYVNFKDTTFKKELDLSKISFKENVDFLNIKVYENNINRETARIIKHSFEKQDNIIEANKFYAIEMEKREKELREKKPFDWLNWLVFKFHKLSSNYSQDWLLALLWIVFFGITASLYEIYLLCTCSFNLINLITINLFLISPIIINQKFDKFNQYYFLVLYLFSYFFIVTNCFPIEPEKTMSFAKTINPFSTMTGNYDIDILQLLFKIIIAYLIYQFIISIRQNTRRK